MKNLSLCITWCMVIYPLCAEELLNLDDFAQDFVLATKQIIIPGYKGAFNPAIIRWNGSLLLSFRVRNAQLISTFQIGFVWLDEEFNPIGDPSILEIYDDHMAALFQRQDPRLIVFNNRLYMIYSNFIRIGNILTRRIFIAEVHQKNNAFFIIQPLCLHPFEGWSKRWEKNWSPFIFNNTLLFAYSLKPHRIFEPSLETGECRTHSTSTSCMVWPWGELRGGTPAVRDGDEYVAFFHSSKSIATVQSDGKKMAHYVMGAYTFSAKPPFQITRISSTPIIGKDFYHAPPYNTWKPLRVVFPMGCIVDQDYIWVTYGRQDFEVWVAKIDKKGLYASLIPCSLPDTCS